MIIVNMSVWKDIESLKIFAFKTLHANVMRGSNKRFEKPKFANLALWWISAGTIPTTDDAKKRLEGIEKNGDTSFAFSFKNIFLP